MQGLSKGGQKVLYTFCIRWLLPLGGTRVYSGDSSVASSLQSFTSLVVPPGHVSHLPPRLAVWLTAPIGKQL